jgi:putative endopeptidase
MERTYLTLQIATVLLCAYVPCAMASQTEDEATGDQPYYGTYGFDTAGMDVRTAPGDDFYQYLNGNWQKTARIAAERPINSMFTHLADRAQNNIQAIIESAAKANDASSPEAKKVADAYRSFMDNASVEVRGLTPLEDVLSAIDKINSRDALVVQMAALKREEGLATPLGMSIEHDGKRPGRYWVIVGQDGLGLGNRDLYDSSNKTFEKQRARYKAYLQQLFTLARFNKPAHRAQVVYALEEKLAQAHWAKDDNLYQQGAYSLYHRQAWQEQAPGVNWQAWFERLGLSMQMQFGVRQPNALMKTAVLIGNEPLESWKNYLHARVLDDAAPYLPQSFAQARLQFHGVAVSGTPQNQERSWQALRFVELALPNTLGKLYVAKHFPPEMKARADALVQNLLKAMGARIKNLGWMSNPTKTRALQKLAAYKLKIGYPNQWKNDTALQIRPDDLMGNVRRVYAFRYDNELGKLGRPVDDNEWPITPMATNGYYNPQLNELVFPAAMLQPPFFDLRADDAVNYGAIGSLIGHEIIHGFDSIGRQYDAKGAKNDWWTEKDAQRFNTSAERLVAQYNAYCPFTGHCVNGKLTLGENIADLGGLAVAYDAYQLSLQGKPAPVIAERTGERRFFEGFGQVWRSLIHEDTAKSRLTTESYSPDQIRALIVRNFAPWYEVYKPTPEQKLFLKPEERVIIW